MKASTAVGVFFALLLLSCEPRSIREEGSFASSDPLLFSSSSSFNQQWTTYRDASLGIRIDYPEGIYTVSQEKPEFEDNRLEIEAGVRFSDQFPEGNSVSIYRTDNAAIVDFLKQQHTFMNTETIHGLVWQEFACTGGCMGDSYGYMSERNGWYYVFESTWGPDNPVSETMLQSLAFE